jgi:hypothetical protein
MRSSAPLPNGLSGRSFTLHEARQQGITRRRTESAAFHVPSRGIRVPWDVEQPLLAVVRPLCALTPMSAVSFFTAARLWKIPLPYFLERDLSIHVTRPRAAAAPQRNGVTGHKMALLAGEVTQLDGVPVTTPARTWLDLARLLDLEALIAAGDAVVNTHHRMFQQPKRALASLDELRAVARNHPRSRGLVNARLALDLIRVGSDSPPETRLRLALVRAGLPEPVLGYVICDGTGGELAWPDQAFPQFRVAVQYDGGHHFTREQAELDVMRNEAVASAGWAQVIVTRRMFEAFGEPGVVGRVRTALLRAGWRSEGASNALSAEITTFPARETW